MAVYLWKDMGVSLWVSCKNDDFAEIMESQIRDLNSQQSFPPFLSKMMTRDLQSV